MSSEIAKQEKNLRALEFQLKRAMDDEQTEFGQEIQGLQIDMIKLRELNHVEQVSSNAELVRKLDSAIRHAEERARIFNSREGLFNSPATEYTELIELSKTFEVTTYLHSCTSCNACSRTSTCGTPLSGGSPPRRAGSTEASSSSTERRWRTRLVRFPRT